MTNPFNDNLAQRAHTCSHGGTATPAEAQCWEDGGDAIFPGETRPARSLINLFMAVRNALIEQRRRRRTYDELMALDDRALADIGMHRSQLPAIVETMYEGSKLRPVDAPALSPHAPIEHARRWVDGHHRQILTRRGLTAVS